LVNDYLDEVVQNQKMSWQDIKLNREDLIPIEEFPLKWRWTEKKDATFSGIELSRIRPLAKSTSKQIWDLTLLLTSYDDQEFVPNTELFEKANKYSYSGKATELSQWLNAHLVKETCDLVVSWQPGSALMTDTDILVNNWQSFIYPEDEVTIIPLDLKWVLFFSRQEVVYHAVRK
jgi:hypothetical protein